MYDKQTFLSQLHHFIERRGFTCSDLAHAIGTSPTTVYRYASGAREPDLKMLIKIGDVLHVSIDELLGLDIPEPIEPPPTPVDITTLLACYQRASEADRDVLWSLLSRYMTASEKAAITALRTKQEGQVG